MIDPNRRDILRMIAAAGAAAAAGPAPLEAWAQEAAAGSKLHGHSLAGALKYGAGFPHFSYANPNAPHGGTARLSVGAQFDSFNPFTSKGRPASGMASLVFENLMTRSFDEGSTHYGLLAEWMEIAPDHTWTTFGLRKEARFHDGSAVTAQDVVNSFELLTTKGNPLYRYYYADVERVTDEGDGVVRFHFKNGDNRELPHILGQVTVLPAKWWETRDFAETTLEPPVGSGPYRIENFEAGRYVEFVRNDDYWGAKLPVRLGHYNFDRIRFDYFLDQDTQFEAFKKGEVDYWRENSAKRWAKRYDFPAAKSGEVKKAEILLEGPKRVQGFVFNLRRQKFADRKVREALNLVFDFQWLNRAVFFDQYARPSSYFQGSDKLRAMGVPQGEELALLEGYRDQLPPEVFSAPYEDPVTDASGRIRRNLRKASKLLEEAGWRVENGVRINGAGEAFTLEFLSFGDSQQPVVGPFLKNVERLGVQTSFRGVDAAQFVERRNSYDFDMLIGAWLNSESPGNEQREMWGASAADQPGGRNLPGVKNAVVDALIEKIVVATTRNELEVASRALDRVLLWERYAILELYTPFERIAYWDKFGAPEKLPSREIGFPSIWWYDEAKAAKL